MQDSLYFDRVLEARRSDSIKQSNCIIQATRMGQEATEHLANLQDDFRILEKQIKENMKDSESSEKRSHFFVSKLFNSCAN